eukprot:g25946.t1
MGRDGLAPHFSARLFAEPFYRLAHGEADHLPGLVIDRYDDHLCIQPFSGLDELLWPIADALDEVLKPKVVIIRQAPAPSHPRAADLLSGQKTGWYYDQRENRLMLANLVRGSLPRVLDVYSYVGGFGVLLAHYGAASVLCVDSSEAALELLRRSAAMNAVQSCVRSIRADAMDFLQEKSRQKAAGEDLEDSEFDLVILDPPNLGVDRLTASKALRHYEKLVTAAASLCAPVPLLAALAPQLQQRLSADQLRAPHLAQVCGAYCHARFLESTHVTVILEAARFTLKEATPLELTRLVRAGIRAKAANAELVIKEAAWLAGAQAEVMLPHELARTAGTFGGECAAFLAASDGGEVEAVEAFAASAELLHILTRGRSAAQVAPQLLEACASWQLALPFGLLAMLAPTLQPGDAAARVLEQFKGSLPLTVAELLHLFELLALPGVGLLEYAGLSATSLEAEVDMQCFCDFLFDQHLGHEFRAVSVWHLTHALLPAVEAAGHLATARVYEIEPTVIRPKGYKHCLARMGSAYVDGIFGPCHAGPASFMLSYTWGYQVGDIAETLNDFCEKHELKPQEAYVWICCLCINQHRVHEASSRGDVVPFEQFERAFGESFGPKERGEWRRPASRQPRRVSGIGHVIAMMSPWDDPLYISRVWTAEEMFTAICVAKSQVTVVMPPSEAMDLRAELMHGRGIGAVWNTLSKLNVECAQASVSRDRELILEMIQQGPGYHRLNTVIGEHLKEWILCACEGHILRSLEVEELEDDHAIAGLCNEVGSLLISLGYLERAEHLLQEGLRLKEQHLDLEKSADGAELMSNLGEIYEKKGAMTQVVVARTWDLEAASQLYQRATRAFQLCSPASTAAMAKATSLRRLGRLRGVQGDLAAKLELYSSARQVLEEAESLQTPEGAVLLNSLGAAKRQEGDLEAALEAYEAALKIHASLQTIDTPEGAALLSNIGVARMKQKKKKKAKQAFEQALTIREPKTNNIQG